jgi:hypothetical protein
MSSTYPELGINRPMPTPELCRRPRGPDVGALNALGFSPSVEAEGRHSSAAG